MVRMRAGLLRHFDFRQLLLADAVSQLGTQVTMLAMPLVAVLALNASRVQVGLLAACESAAFLLVGLPAGAWVDRWRRRRVLVVNDLCRAALLGTVPLAWWLGRLGMPQLFAVALLTGVCTVFFDVAYQSYLPHLVERDELVEGNAKLEAVRGVNQIAGPTVGGLLVQALGGPFAIAVNAATFLGSAAFLGRIRSRETRRPRAADAHLGREIREGLRFVLGNRLLRAIAGCTSSANLFAAITAPMAIVLLARELRVSAGVIGVVLSMSSVGALLGALAAPRVTRLLGQGRTLWMAMAFSAPFEVLLPLAQRGWLLWAAATGWAFGWFGAIVYNITQVSFRQRLTPERLLGRMNASMRFLVWGPMPLGGVLGGLLGQYLGVRPALWIAAVGQMLAFLPTFLSPLRRMRELPSGAEFPPGAAGESASGASGEAAAAEAVPGEAVPGGAVATPAA